jgi:hypothetical protein
MTYLGINPFIIMQIIGNKDTKTAKRYTNPTDEHMLAAMPKVSRQQENYELTERAEKVKSDVMISI